MNPGIIVEVVKGVVGGDDGAVFVPEDGGANFVDVEAVFVVQPGDAALKALAGVYQVVYQENARAEVGGGHAEVLGEGDGASGAVAFAAVRSGRENGQGLIGDATEDIADAEAPFGKTHNLIKFPAGAVYHQGQLFDVLVII